MQLKLKRSQRTGGLMGGKTIFALDIRAEYAPAERDSINKYSLGGEVIYNSQKATEHLDRSQQASSAFKALGSLALAKMNLNITIASLAKGHHIECKDLAELLGCEEAIHAACTNIRSYLDAAATFDGREVVLDVEGAA